MSGGAGTGFAPVAVVVPRAAGGGLLCAFACATVALAPVEGYLLGVHPQLAKVPAVLFVLTWAIVRARQRRPPAAHPVHGPLLLLAVVILASAAVHAAEPFTMEYTLRWLPFLLVTVLLLDVAAREVPVGALLGSAAFGAAVAGAGALYSLLAEGQARAHGPLEDPNDLAFVLVTALPLLAALVPGVSGRHRRIVASVAVLAAAVLVAGAVATFSRGGALALLAATGWLLARRALPPKVLAGAGAFVLALGVVAVLATGPGLARAVQEKVWIAQSNVDTRELRWQVAAQMAAENPVLGVGPGGFRGEYASVSRLAEIHELTPVAHNMYLEVGAELGLPGLVAFLGLIGCAVLASERALRRGADRTVVVAVQASLLAALIASAFLSEQYYLPLWFTVALAGALDLRSADVPEKERRVLRCGSYR